MKYTALLLCLLTGCASSSGVLSTAPGRYTITTQASPGKGGVPAAKRMAYQEATAECTKQQRQLEILDETTASPTWTEGMASATLAFHCV